MLSMTVHHQQLFDANHAERAKGAECKANKANGIAIPDQSDNENRDIGSVLLLLLLFSWIYISAQPFFLVFLAVCVNQTSTLKAALKAALVQRENKVYISHNTPAC